MQVSSYNFLLFRGIIFRLFIDLARILAEANADERYAFIGRKFNSSNNDRVLTCQILIGSVVYIFFMHMQSSLKIGIVHSCFIIIIIIIIIHIIFKISEIML